jgi:hypothetical protein
MIKCKVCFATNPDAATVCSVCKATLDKPAAARVPARKPTSADAAPDAPPRRVTVFEDVSASAPSALQGAGQAQPAEKAAAAPGVSQRRVTVFDPSTLAGASAKGSSAEPGKAPVSTAGRKIVGVLVTYSWSDQGQIFPVCEGRNRIGSDPVQCDIAVPQDDTLSAINSHIVFRKSFTIGDDVSMGGTDVDGEPVEIAFVPLRNYARIRTGSTHWTFIAVEPPKEGQ